MNVTEKRLRGYEEVRPGDPEVKGTILEKNHTADNKIQVGNLMLARISEENFQKHAAKVRERTGRKLRMIKRDYLEQGEKIQKKMGTSKHFKPIIHTEE